jgi:hypothetical protein
MLFCGPLGPNIRNDTAHGLLSDTAAIGSAALYSWWFALKLVLMFFWNNIHDADAAAAREPARPGERAAGEPPQSETDGAGEPSDTADSAE